MTTSTIAGQVRAARLTRGLSQDELAAMLRDDYGIPTASKRMIQRWENGVTPSREYAVVLMNALGITNMQVIADGTGARHVHPGAAFTPPAEPEGAQASDGRLPGIWMVRYQYWSTGREGVFISQYHAVLEQDGNHVTVESLPFGSHPHMSLDLTVQGSYLTGRWDEWTDPAGHYLGDLRWGALQLRMNPSHRWMGGLWVGWGSGERINSGPFELVWIAGDTSDESLDRYAHSLPDAPAE